MYIIRPNYIFQIVKNYTRMKSTRESKMKENINFSKIKFKTYSINMLYIILIYIHGIFLKSWF